MNYLLYIIALISIVAFIVGMVLGAIKFTPNQIKESDLRFDEWHHLYLGVLLYIVGLQVLGVVLMVDDGYQHFVQAVSSNLKYRSPCHKLYAFVLEKIKGNLV